MPDGSSSPLGYVVVTMAAGLAAVRVGQLAVEARR